MHIVRRLGSRRFKLVPDDPPKPEPKKDEGAAPEVAPKPRRGVLSALGMVTGLNTHSAVFSRFFGPAMSSLKSHGRDLLGEVFKSAEILGAKYFPKASSRRLGPISAGGLLVLLIGFGPCIFFASRAVLRVIHMVENYQVRATRDLAEGRKAREAARAQAVTQSNSPSSQEKKP